ncbi:uncharacterized protein [Eucyclogobius newberryi]|uniref:uncharacterized protein n=1 Tax=Eucyclogobius newberryi TaxID=166745 RepID=UPI003B5C082C
MEEDNDLEKRAIEELLKETDRGRERAETMGPTGWLKCPLKSTNKRFLLNTLRSSSLQRRSDESNSESTSRRRMRSESSDRRRDRSRSPPHRDGERHRGHRDKFNREDSSMKHKRREKEKERRDGHTRERKPVKENGSNKKHRHK